MLLLLLLCCRLSSARGARPQGSAGGVIGTVPYFSGSGGSTFRPTVERYLRDSEVQLQLFEGQDDSKQSSCLV